MGSEEIEVVARKVTARLFLLLYGEAIKFCKLAVKELQAGNYSTSSKYINRARNHLGELDCLLDKENGGKAVQSLHAQYLFLRLSLRRASTERNPRTILQVVKALEELAQSWRGLAK